MLLIVTVEEMVDILNDANTIPKVIQIMKEHINIPCELYTLSTPLADHVIPPYSHTEEGLPADQTTDQERRRVDLAEECIIQCLTGHHGDQRITTSQA